MDKTKKIEQVTIITGGQYGSEGKGEIAATVGLEANDRLSGHKGFDHVIRTGGPNAGHTVTLPGKVEGKTSIVFRHLPASFSTYMMPCAYWLGPGALVEPGLLVEELEMVGKVLGSVPIINIDPEAVVVGEEHKAAEETADLNARTGSTREGIGAARADHIWRQAETWRDWFEHGFGDDRDDVIFNHTRLASVAENVHGRVLIEATQGYGLSLSYSGLYPQTTSADLVPTAILAAAGIGHTQFESPLHTIAVCRTYPIRVAGNSGPLPGEVDWVTLNRRSGGAAPFEGEKTTVTGKTRRIGEWDWVMFQRMVRDVRPSEIALTFLDYLFPSLQGKQGWGSTTPSPPIPPIRRRRSWRRLRGRRGAR